MSDKTTRPRISEGEAKRRPKYYTTGMWQALKVRVEPKPLGRPDLSRENGISPNEPDRRGLLTAPQTINTLSHESELILLKRDKPAPLFLSQPVKLFVERHYFEFCL